MRMCGHVHFRWLDKSTAIWIWNYPYLVCNQHAGKITLWAARIILLTHKLKLFRRERCIMEFFFDSSYQKVLHTWPH